MMIKRLSVAILLILTLFSCKEPLDVQENFGFELLHMPYFNNIKTGTAVEIRCNLKEEGRFIDRKYTIRHFPFSGQGQLRVGRLGDAMLPNDRYEIYAGEFRLFYTPTVHGSHDIEVVIESSDGTAQTLSLRINSSETGRDMGIGNVGKEHIDMSAIGLPKDGIAHIGENGNYWIDGKDSGVKVPESGDVYNPTISVNQDGTYQVNGENTNIVAPNRPNTITNLYDSEEELLNHIITPDPSLLNTDSVSVILVSKGRTILHPETQKEVVHAGVRVEDGGVIYRVYDKLGQPAPNARVSRMPRLEGKQYQADKNGLFFVPKEDLPEKGDTKIASCESVIIGGQVYKSSSRTLVPNRVLLSIHYSHHDDDNGFYFTLAHLPNSDDPLAPAMPSDFNLEDYKDRVTVYNVRLEDRTFPFRHKAIAWSPVPKAWVTIEGSLIKVKPDLPIKATPEEVDKGGIPIFFGVTLTEAPYGSKAESPVQIVGIQERSSAKKFADTFFRPFGI